MGGDHGVRRRLDSFGPAQDAWIDIRKIIAQVMWMDGADDRILRHISFAILGLDPSDTRARADQLCHVLAEHELTAMVFDAADERVRKTAGTALGQRQSGDMRRTDHRQRPDAGAFLLRTLEIVSHQLYEMHPNLFMSQPFADDFQAAFQRHEQQFIAVRTLTQHRNHRADRYWWSEQGAGQHREDADRHIREPPVSLCIRGGELSYRPGGLLYAPVGNQQRSVVEQRRERRFRIDVLEPESRLESQLILFQQRIGQDDLMDRGVFIVMMRGDELFGYASSPRVVVSFQNENALSRLGHISSGYETMMAGAHRYHVKGLRHAVPLAAPVNDSRPIILFVHPEQKSLLEIHRIGADDESMEAHPTCASSAQMPGIPITAFGEYRLIPILARTK